VACLGAVTAFFSGNAGGGALEDGCGAALGAALGKLEATPKGV
jgi:hypothetical protein